MMRLATLLSPDYLIAGLSGSSKLEATDELLRLISAHDPGIDVKLVWEKILERESIEDTSYGRGFAFPHARTDAVSKMHLALGVSKTGLEACRDGSPLKVVCLLLTPSSISKLYLQTLSALASFARGEGNIERLAKCETPAEMLDVIWESGVMVNKEITVSDLMRHDPVAVTETETLRDVANLMFRFRLSGLPVVDADGRLLGHVTDRDLLTAALPDYKALVSNHEYQLPVEPFEELLGRADSIDVSQIFQEDFETVHPEASIVRAAARMVAQDSRRMYVVDDDNRLLGVLHRKDIVNMILRG
ncbi:MAG TPA: CBS domain-containing protein [candidate division Zixibacteria bacterium]|nr:CBS domain-containing protein [candidate division Zixibacteria bacterium]